MLLVSHLRNIWYICCFFEGKIFFTFLFPKGSRIIGPENIRCNELNDTVISFPHHQRGYEIKQTNEKLKKKTTLTKKDQC